jgi:hypothetical protein
MAEKKARKSKKKVTKEAATEVSAPQELVLPRLTETEVLKLGKLSAELQKELLSAKTILLEGQAYRSKVEEELKKREEIRLAHVQNARTIKEQYDQLTGELAKKYGIESPERMIVDPDTGVVRDSQTI